jgi:hypothetical protein
MWWARRDFYKGSADIAAGGLRVVSALWSRRAGARQIRQTLAPRIDREVDGKRRPTLIRQSEAVKDRIRR